MTSKEKDSSPTKSKGFFSKVFGKSSKNPRNSLEIASKDFLNSNAAQNIFQSGDNANKYTYTGKGSNPALNLPSPAGESGNLKIVTAQSPTKDGPPSAALDSPKLPKSPKRKEVGSGSPIRDSMPATPKSAKSLESLASAKGGKEIALKQTEKISLGLINLGSNNSVEGSPDLPSPPIPSSSSKPKKLVGSTNSLNTISKVERLSESKKGSLAKLNDIGKSNSPQLPRNAPKSAFGAVSTASPERQNSVRLQKAEGSKPDLKSNLSNSMLANANLDSSKQPATSNSPQMPRLGPISAFATPGSIPERQNSVRQQLPKRQLTKLGSQHLGLQKSSSSLSLLKNKPATSNEKIEAWPSKEVDLKPEVADTKVVETTLESDPKPAKKVKKSKVSSIEGSEGNEGKPAKKSKKKVKDTESQEPQEGESAPKVKKKKKAVAEGEALGDGEEKPKRKSKKTVEENLANVRFS